jgi:hypothetical protein
MSAHRPSVGPVLRRRAPTRTAEGHEFGPEQLWVGHSGPLDGEWLVRSCLHCNAFEIWPRSGGPCIDLILAAFAK